MATLVEISAAGAAIPAADVNGDVPFEGGESAKWFVVWPEPDDRTIVVRANPLHPETRRRPVPRRWRGFRKRSLPPSGRPRPPTIARSKS